MDWIEKSKKWLKENLLEIENQPGSADDKAKKLIKLFCSVCAGLAAQPVPFADIFVLTPLQVYMGTRLAAIRGVKLSEQEAATFVKQLGATVGLGFVAQQAAIGFYKFIPYLGVVTTVPLVFALTYAIGSVMDLYLKTLAEENRQMTPDEIMQIFNDMMEKGKAVARTSKDAIEHAANEIRRN